MIAAALFSRSKKRIKNVHFVFRKCTFRFCGYTFNPDLTGHAYFQMANVLTKAHDLKGALAYCEKAAAADITVANRANQLKEALSKAIEQQANNAKANAEYQEYLRKKKAEEDFWKGGK